MQIAVLGTGAVGRTLAGALATLGHDVTVGTRDPAATLARTDPDARGTPPFARWHRDHPGVAVATFADAARDAELVVDAASGAAALDVLSAAGAEALADKVLLDVANPLDFSTGEPALLTSSTESLAERIQAAFPAARVVKALNTMNAAVMVDPASVPGEHDLLVAGDDEDAKATVVDLLGQLGWPADRVIDLGGIDGARGMEHWLLLWIRLAGALGTMSFNLRIARP